MVSEKVKPSRYTVFVLSISSETVHKYFSSFGRVVDVMMGKARSFAFVTFNSQDAALKAIEQRFHIFKNRRAEAKLAVERGKEFVNKIFVDNLPYFVNRGEIKILKAHSLLCNLFSSRGSL